MRTNLVARGLASVALVSAFAMPSLLNSSVAVAQDGPPPPPANCVVVAQGLSNPRDISVAEDGTIYVVEFWATWCPHCANAVSYLTDIQHTYGPRGVQVVAISWEAVDTVRNYVEARGDAMDYAVAVDNYSATFLVYDAIYDITGVPHVFLVDGEGRFVWRGHPVDPALIQHLLSLIHI